MRVEYIPQRIDKPLTYTFDGETATANMGEETDSWDFSALPDGEALEIESSLDPCPILKVRRENGELHLTVVKAIPARPNPLDYDTQEQYEFALEDWKAMWVVTEEVVD